MRATVVAAALIVGPPTAQPAVEEAPALSMIETRYAVLIGKPDVALLRRRLPEAVLHGAEQR